MSDRIAISKYPRYYLQRDDHGGLNCDDRKTRINNDHVKYQFIVPK